MILEIWEIRNFLIYIFLFSIIASVNHFLLITNYCLKMKVKISICTCFLTYNYKAGWRRKKNYISQACGGFLPFIRFIPGTLSPFGAPLCTALNFLLHSYNLTLNFLWLTAHSILRVSILTIGVRAALPSPQCLLRTTFQTKIHPRNHVFLCQSVASLLVLYPWGLKILHTYGFWKSWGQAGVEEG